MKRFFAAIVAVLLAPSAYAADLQPKAPPYVAQSMARWSGIYFGAQVGGEFSAQPITGVTSGPFTSLGDPGAFGPNAVGFMGGAHAGMNYQFSSNLVLGIEGGGELSSLNSNGITSLGAMQANAVVSKPWDAYVIGKLGIVAGPRGDFLFYGLGGGAAAELKNDTTVTDTLCIGAGCSVKQSAGNVHFGWTAGAGIDWKALDHLIIGVRYRYSNYGTHGVVFTDNRGEEAFRSDQHAADNQFTLRGSLLLN